MAAENKDAKENPVMGDKEFQDLVDSLLKGFCKDPDKMKRIKAATANYKFTCKQTITLGEATKNIWCDTVVLLYPVISDKDNFSTVLKMFKFKEERAEVLQRLGLDK
jgi:hypothetical protein